MVGFCCVPGCSNNSKRNSKLSFFSLALKRKGILKQWIHCVGRKNVPINKHTRLCSEHFVLARGRLLRPDEVPSLHLSPTITSIETKKSRNVPRERAMTETGAGCSADDCDVDDGGLSCDISMQTVEEKLESQPVEQLLERVATLEKQLKVKNEQIVKRKFGLATIKDDDSQVCFYTGFESYRSLQVFLGGSFC